MTNANQSRSIGIDAWCVLAKEECAPPVTIPLEGSSMMPLIRRSMDPVTIVPLQRPLKKGDKLYHGGYYYGKEDLCDSRG